MSVTPRGVTTLDANPQAARQVEGHFQERTMGERSEAFVDRIGGGARIDFSGGSPLPRNGQGIKQPKG